MTLADDISHNAAFLRDGIASGVIAPDVAVSWADALIAEHAQLPAAVYDLSIAAGRRTMPVLDALTQLAATPELTESTARALLDLLGSRLDVGVLSAGQAIVTAYHLTRALGPQSAIWTKALCLEEDYSMAQDGIVGSLHEMDTEVRSWFDQFRGSMANFSVHAV